MTNTSKIVGTIHVHSPRRVDKPWGYELIFAHTDRYVGKILHIEPGQALSRQYHNVKDETIFVTSGEMILDVGEGADCVREVIGSGETFRVTPGTIHRFSTEDSACDIVEVSTPELDDVVRLEDRYGREGTSAP